MHDWPQWKTRPENSHSGRILALAQCIFDCYYRTENHSVDGPIKTFDNMCSGDLERVANVLAQSGFIRFIDDIGRRSVFKCSSTDFEKIAQGEDARRVDAEKVYEAVQRMAEGSFYSSEAIGYLADLAKHR